MTVWQFRFLVPLVPIQRSPVTADTNQSICSKKWGKGLGEGWRLVMWGKKEIDIRNNCPNPLWVEEEYLETHKTRQRSTITFLLEFWLDEMSVWGKEYLDISVSYYIPAEDLCHVVFPATCHWISHHCVGPFCPGRSHSWVWMLRLQWFKPWSSGWYPASLQQDSTL